MNNELASDAWRQAMLSIQQLRDHGYAVVIFNPEELSGCPADDLESALISEAWDAIDHINAMTTGESQ